MPEHRIRGRFSGMEYDMVMGEHRLRLDKPALHQKLRQRVQPIHHLPSARRLQKHPHQLDVEVCITQRPMHHASSPTQSPPALRDAILTIKTHSYDVSQSAIVADVAYDAFLGGSACIGPGGTHPIEVMIWLGAYGNLGTSPFPPSITTTTIVVQPQLN